MSTVQIIADDRESQAGVIEALKRQNETEVSVRRLALGDYLLEQFGSVEAVLSADEQALPGVAGIGAGRAKSIRRAVGEQWASYSLFSTDE
jgi:ERCC4-type nuclease